MTWIADGSSSTTGGRTSRDEINRPFGAARQIHPDTCHRTMHKELSRLLSQPGACCTELPSGSADPGRKPAGRARRLPTHGWARARYRSWVEPSVWQHAQPTRARSAVSDAVRWDPPAGLRMARRPAALAGPAVARSRLGREIDGRSKRKAKPSREACPLTSIRGCRSRRSNLTNIAPCAAHARTLRRISRWQFDDQYSGAPEGT